MVFSLTCEIGLLPGPKTIDPEVLESNILMYCSNAATRDSNFAI